MKIRRISQRNSWRNLCRNSGGSFCRKRWKIFQRILFRYFLRNLKKKKTAETVYGISGKNFEVIFEKKKKIIQTSCMRFTHCFQTISYKNLTCQKFLGEIGRNFWRTGLWTKTTSKLRRNALQNPYRNFWSNFFKNSKKKKLERCLGECQENFLNAQLEKSKMKPLEKFVEKPQQKFLEKYLKSFTD